MQILAIGNSFSEDATRYLHAIARADGVKLDVANLYIGGCTLERHYRNLLSEQAVYGLQYNGETSGFFVSLKEALLNRKWDVITLQQASPVSFKSESYFPYITELATFIRRCQPAAKLYLHQTWAYEQNSNMLFHTAKYESSQAMLRDVVAAYEKAATTVRADGMIRSGELLGRLTDQGISPLYRDGFHASLGVGRYALGLMWYRTLVQCDVLGNSFSDFDIPISKDDVQTVKTCVEAFWSE